MASRPAAGGESEDYVNNRHYVVIEILPTRYKPFNFVVHDQMNNCDVAMSRERTTADEWARQLNQTGYMEAEP